MGKMPTNSLGKSSELKLHCFCLFDAYSMPKDMCSVLPWLGTFNTFKVQEKPLLFLPLFQDGVYCHDMAFVVVWTTLYWRAPLAYLYTRLLIG